MALKKMIKKIEFDEELEVVVVIEFDLGVHDLVDVSVEVEFLATHGG